jgi:competence protein ComEC
VEGRFLTRPLTGGSYPFQLEAGAPGGCVGTVRALLPSGAELPRAGVRIRVEVSWERRAFPMEGNPEWTGRLRLAGSWTPSSGGGLSGSVLAFRGKVQERIAELWGEGSAPMVEALVLARREHLDPDLRNAFGLSGTAHLLAISGFHVGVVAALLVGLLRLAGLSRRPAEGGAVAGCWIYVLAIGAPHAAVRASLLLTLLICARLRGQPVVPAGALGSALLLLLLIHPEWLASVGFQLSFAGTAGLVCFRKPVSRLIDRGLAALTGRDRGRRRSGPGQVDLLRGASQGLSAGVAATLPTLPLLAWHFDRISLIGIPATLVVAPVVSAAIPGIGASLLLSVISEFAGRFAAGGSGLLLDVVGRVILWTSGLPGASIWVSRPALVASMVGGGTVFLLLEAWGRGIVRPAWRRACAAGWALILVILLPLAPGHGVLEVHVIDVGQGDAIAVRSPGGRWLLVDTGPRSPGFDAGDRRVVPYLRRQGVRQIEAVVLTHPHLDHIGGAPAILRELPVRGVLDPSRPHGSLPYLEVIEAAMLADTWWWVGSEGRSFEFDGVRASVLHPDRDTVEDPLLDDPNDLSIVLLIEWEEVAILLTGDAPAEVERRVLDRLPPLTVLKVGHHGSRTSTSLELLEATRPQVAVIGVGNPNSFGHPHELVMSRLTMAGTDVFRTDRDGNIRLRLGPDGNPRVETGR